MASTYKGPERRRYHVLVCENVEFHLRDNRCIAVKNRHTGLWATGHAAAGSAIVDGPAKALQVGDSVRFTQDNATYRISGIERPSHYKAGTEPPGLADESAG